MIEKDSKGPAEGKCHFCFEKEDLRNYRTTNHPHLSPEESDGKKMMEKIFQEASSRHTSNAKLFELRSTQVYSTLEKADSLLQ